MDRHDLDAPGDRPGQFPRATAALQRLALHLDAQLRDAVASRDHCLEALQLERRRAAAAQARARALDALVRQQRELLDARDAREAA